MAELGRSGLTAKPAATTDVKAALSEAKNQSQSVVVVGFYTMEKGTLTLYGQIYDADTGSIIDAYNLTDELADLDELLPGARTRRADADTLIQRFAERLAARAATNPNRRQRRENINEFVTQSPIRDLVGVNMTVEEKKEGAEVFQMLEEQVVVSGTRTELKLREVPATIRVITEDDIRRHGYQYLEEVLRDQPGFDSIFFQGLYGPIFVQRGLDAPENLRTLVFVDGLLENNISAGSAYIKHKYNLHNVKRIEILYGPASSLYGANAFTGIINIITKNAEDVKNGFEYTAGSYYYEPDFHRPAPNASASVSRRFGDDKDAPSIIASGSWINSLGPILNNRDNQTPSKSTYYWSDSYTGSRIDNNHNVEIKATTKYVTLGAMESKDYSGQGTFATGAAYSDNGQIAFWNTLNRTAYGKFQADLGSKFKEQLQVSYRETAVTDGTDADLTTFGSTSGKVTITRYKRPDSEIAFDNPFFIKWSQNANTIIGASMSVQKAYNYSTRAQDYNSVIELQRTKLPEPPNVDPSKRFYYRNSAGYLQHYWRFMDSTSMTLGLRYDTFSIKGREGPEFCGTDERTLPGGAANPSFIAAEEAAARGCTNSFFDPNDPIDTKTLAPKLRTTRDYYRRAPADKTYSSQNPRLGFVYSPSSRLSARILYGEAFRAPTVREFYSGSSSRLTNASLRPEKIRTVEGGLIYYPLPELRTEGSVYYNYVQDMIFLAGTEIHRPGRGAGSNYSQFQNAGKAQVVGADLSADTSPLGWLKLYAGYTYQDSRLFDVNDSTVLAHETVPDEKEKIRNVDICRAALSNAGYPLLRPACGQYDGEMPRVARHKLNLGSNFIIRQHFVIDLRANWIDARANIATNPTQRVPAYFLMNAGLGVRDWPIQRLDFTLKVFNVFNQEILDPGFRDGKGDYFPSAHPQPGRYIGFLITHRL